MLSKDRVWELFQKVYFDSVDKGDMTKAASAFHEDVEWVHTQVWEHDQYQRSKGSDRLEGRKAVEAFLKARATEVGRLNVRHVVRDLVFEGNRGAFIGYVGTPDKELPLVAWFETKDDKIFRYTVAPLYIP